MSYGRNRNSLSKCAAEWLDAHRFFNAGENAFNRLGQINREATIRMHAPAAASDAIRLRFEVSDSDGLHRALLYIRPMPADPANDFKLQGCRLLETETSTIEFVTHELVEKSQDEVTLQVIDKYGGMTRQKFPINIAPLLPPPKVVPIPDANLAAAVRKALGLDRNMPITQQAMQRLTELDARGSKIKNLTGLEHATQLTRLDLQENQIQDISPLIELTKLRGLFLGSNQIRNIASLANLTKLHVLDLGYNFRYITHLAGLTQLNWTETPNPRTPLTELTKLKEFQAWQNQIRDITPLTKLTKLEKLFLTDNNISDITGLSNLKLLEVLTLFGNESKIFLRSRD